MYNGGYYQPAPYYPQQAPYPPAAYYNGAAMGPQQYNPYMMNGYGMGRGGNMAAYPPQHGYPMQQAPVVVSSPIYGPGPGMNGMPIHPQSPAIVSSPYGPPPLPGTPSSTHSAYIQPAPLPHGPALSINVPPPMMQHDAGHVLPTPVATSAISVTAKEFIPMSASLPARPRADSELSEGAQFLKDFNSNISQNKISGAYELAMENDIITVSRSVATTPCYIY